MATHFGIILFGVDARVPEAGPDAGDRARCYRGYEPAATRLTVS